MKRAGLIATALTGLALGAFAPAASAHEDPAGCSSSGINVSFDQVASGLTIVRRNGDRLELTARVRNDAANACSVTNATVTIQTPNPDGAPGPTTTIAQNTSFPGGTGQATLPTKLPYDVNFDAATFSAPVTVAISGTSHLPGGDTSGFITSQGIPIVISKPTATLSVTPVQTSGSAPFSATYNYSLTNTSPENTEPGQPEPGLFKGETPETVLADDTCSPLTFTGTDPTPSTPPILDRGETWTFSCTHMFGTPGTFTNTARIVGDSTRDGRPWPETPTQSSVTATGADMTVTKTHAGNFAPGDTGRAYTIVARNSGNAPTNANAITVEDSLPAGLTATGISGSGWTCERASLSCSRSDALAGGDAFPPITVTVDVAAAAPSQVTNVATVSGGGEIPTGNNTAQDPTNIVAPRGGDGGGGDGGGGGTDGPGGETENPVDRDAPNGEIRKVKVKGGDVKVTFRSDEAGSTFECRLDRKPFKACTSPKTFRDVGKGKHKVFVQATDAAGNEGDAVKAKFVVD